MSKLKKISHWELLAELEQRLPNFTQTELAKLLGLLGKKQEQVLQIIQEVSPRVYSWAQEKVTQLEQEKIDQEAEALKKSLEEKK